MSLWTSLFLRRTLSVFFLSLLGSFVLYILVDFSLHGFKLLEEGGEKLFFYYMHGFGSQISLFFSFSFLLALLRLFFSLIQSGELVALQMAGLSRFRLLLPLLGFGLCLMLLDYAHTEWVLPLSEKKVFSMRKGHLKHKRSSQKSHIHNLSLDDGTEIVYQTYDSENKELFDLFWIRSHEEIWHAKTLSIGLNPPLGRFVDRFIRNAEGVFEKREEFSEHLFKELAWNPKTALQRFIPFESRSLSALFLQTRGRASDRISAQTHLHYKLSLPWISLFLPFFLASFIFRFDRGLPLLWFAAFSLFGLVAFFTWMNSLIILGENQVISAPFFFWGSLAFLFLSQFLFSINVKKR